MWRFLVPIFLAAFLVFQVQPLMGRTLLPWFGGGAAIWTACMLFFQASLLLGYAYAHLLSRTLRPRRQALVHGVLLGASLLLLPIAPELSWQPADPGAPVGRILALLTVCVGAPFVLLAATGPLLQLWFSLDSPERSPYRLYALSNAGSLLGLLSYPFLVEPALGLRAQTGLWSWGYAAFVLAAGWLIVTRYRAATPQAAVGGGSEASVSRRASKMDMSMWLLLSATGSLLLLSTTHQITQDIAPVPFLWIVPLALYLLTFIVCFDDDRWYERRIWTPLFLASLAALVGVHEVGSDAGPLVQLAIYCGAMFVACMVCHGELVRLRPGPQRLTEFYLVMALGGALGGLFVGVIAPVVFTDLWEFHLALGSCFLLFLVALFRDDASALGGGRAPGRWAWLLGSGALLAWTLGNNIREGHEDAIATTRNFYGVLGVYEYGVGGEDWRRYLYHGELKHGGQLMADGRRRAAISYYGPESGAALAIEEHPRRRIAVTSSGSGKPAVEDSGAGNLRIGMVGLGVGSVAAYARPGDLLRVYEINPEVVRLADEYFTYRQDSEARQELVLGDARIQLERELEAGQPQGFDVLILDAFNSDAVPVHLLTKEAFEVYRKHLAPDGILVVHISAIYLDLAPVVRGLAEEVGLIAQRITNHRDRSERISWSEWVVVTSDRTFFDSPAVRARSRPWRKGSAEPIIWTDDYSNLLHVLR